MKLKVPYHAQKRNSTCGLAALRMVLGYFGQEVDENDLVKEVKLHSFGTFSTDLGLLALNRGYKVTAHTFHLSLLGNLNLKFGTVIDQSILKQIKVSPRDKMTFESWKKFIEAGGILIWDYPKLDQLSSSLNDKLPVIISVNTTALNRFWKHWNNGHYLVVAGIDNKVVDILDPDPSDVAQEYQLDKNKLLVACAVNAIQSSNYLLEIKNE